MMSGAMTENAYQLDEEIQRELKGRRTGIGPVANSGPASLPGREQSSSTRPGGCASLHHRLISVAPTILPNGTPVILADESHWQGGKLWASAIPVVTNSCAWRRKPSTRSF